MSDFLQRLKYFFGVHGRVVKIAGPPMTYLLRCPHCNAEWIDDGEGNTW